jgi:integrase
MDEYVRRWLLRNPDASDAQQRDRLRALERFETTMQMTHGALLDLLQQALRSFAGGQVPKLKEVIVEYYQRLRDEGLQPNSAMVTYSPILSFFSANYVTIKDLPKEMMTAQDNAWETNFIPSQDQVRRMIESRSGKRDDKRDKAILAFLAQTGQRVGVLTAMRLEMIRKLESDKHGIVDVSPNFKNPRGENVNKFEVRYKFVIGEDTMQLISDLTDRKEGWLFEGGRSDKPGISTRQINRIVDEAAKAVGIQRPIDTEIAGRHMYVVHPHIFRRTWVERVTEGGMLETYREHMMGHKPPFGGTYIVGLLSDEKLVRAYAKAEARLSLSMPQINESQATPTESGEPEKSYELHLLDEDDWNWAQYRARQLRKESVSRYLFDLIREDKNKAKAEK